MVDIFISYASDDRPRVEPLAQALEARGWSVWWDREILPGKTFSKEIENALNAASCVVVLWSNESAQSDWVQNEAAEGMRKGILVPALIDDVEIPFEFRRIQAANLTYWDAETDGPEFENLIGAISGILGPPSSHIKEAEGIRIKDERRREHEQLRKEQEERKRKKIEAETITKSFSLAKIVGAAGSSTLVIVAIITFFVWRNSCTEPPGLGNTSALFRLIGVVSYGAEDAEVEELYLAITKADLTFMPVIRAIIIGRRGGVSFDPRMLNGMSIVFRARKPINS